MDQVFSRYAIASILLVLLVPFGVLAIIRGVSDKLPFFLVITIPVATPLGAIILGHLARGQVRQSGYIRSGSGIGSTGMVLGYLILSAYLCLAWILVIHPSWRWLARVICRVAQPCRSSCR
jgi:MFS family permease